MKKQRKGFLLLGAILFAFAGCAPAQSRAGEQSPPTIPAQSTQTPETNGAPEPPGLVLHMVSNPKGMLGKPGVGTENGYYDLLQNEDGSVNITYTDYGTATKVFLSSEVAGTRNTESDQSWFSGGVSYLFYENEKLYAVSPGAVLGDSSVLGAIYCMNPNGSDRSKLADLPANQAMMRGVAADEEGDFYTVLEETEEQGNAHSVLTKISAKDGSMDAITELQTGDVMLGIFEDSFVVTHVDTTSSECSLYLVSAQNGATKTLDTFALDSRSDAMWNGEYCYLDYNEKTLNRFNLKSGEKTQIASDIPLLEQKGANNVRGVWGDVFVVRMSRAVEGSQHQSLFGWDLNTGEMFQNTYTYDQDGTKHSPELLTATGNLYLLNLDRNDVEKSGTAPDGTEYQYTQTTFQSATISAKDFWADSQAFTTIQDLA